MVQSSVPRFQGLCSSAKGPRDKGLGDHAEGHEGPDVAPDDADPDLVELAVAIVEVGVRDAEVATGVTPASIVLGDRGVVAHERRVLPTPLGEGTCVAEVTAFTEVGADFLGGHGVIRRFDILLRHDDGLELQTATFDGLAIDATVVVPVRVVAVEVRQLEVAIGDRGQLDGTHVRHDRDVRGRRETCNDRADGSRELPLERTALPEEPLGVVLTETEAAEQVLASLLDEANDSILLTICGRRRDRCLRHRSTLPSIAERTSVSVEPPTFYSPR